jgi:hypothetical protein
MSSASSTSSISPHYPHRSGNDRFPTKRHKPAIKSTVIGKAPHQVERRNARERRRVQAVNKGYEDLANQVTYFLFLSFINLITLSIFRYPTGTS